MKATDSYRKFNNSPLKGIILYYTEKISKGIGEINIGSVIDKIQTGKTPPMSNPKYYEFNDVNWFKPSDIGYSKYLTNAESQFSLIAVEEKKATIYPKDTLLMIGIGGGVGRVSILKEEGSSNQQITGLTFKDYIFSEYAYYYYLVREDYIKSLAKSMSFPILNQDSIKKLNFSYPSFDDQKEFVRFIDNCWESFLLNKLPNFDDFQIDLDFKEYSIKQFKSVNFIDSFNKNTTTQQTLLSTLKQSILQEAIQGKLTADWRTQNPNTETATELLKRIKADKEQLIKDKKIKKEKPLAPITKEEIPFELPVGWVWCRFVDVAEITRGGSPRPIGNFLTTDDNGINWIKIGDTKGDTKYIEKTREKIKPEGLKSSRFVEPGDFLLTNSMSFGRPYIMKTTGCIHDGWLLIRYNKNIINQDYLYHMLSSPYMYKSFVDTAKGGIVQNLNIDKARETIIPIPPLSEQQAIAEKVELLMQKCTALSEEIHSLNTHGITLLKALFNETFETKDEI